MNRKNNKKTGRRIIFGQKNKDYFPPKELKSLELLEKLTETGDYSGVKIHLKKVIYKELHSKSLRERAVYLGAYALAMLNEYRTAVDLLENHKFTDETLDRSYLKCYLSLKLNKPDEVIKYGARFFRLLRQQVSSYKERVNWSCTAFRYEVHNNLALAYKYKQNTYKAIRQFQKAVDINPRHFQSNINYITILYELERYDEALKRIDSALNLFSNNPHLRSLYGITTFSMGDAKRGQEILEELVREYPQSAETVSNLGVMWAKRGEYNKAHNFYKKALEFDPGHKNSRMNILDLEVNHLGKRPTISLCMIVKDEEDNIARCLNSIKDVVDQMVVVDTGSSDRTPEIARELGAEVYFHPWKNSFSEARNNSIKYADSDWIIYLDADEELFEEDKELLRQTATDTTSTAVSLQIFNPLKGDLEGYLQFTRMWRNHLGFHFEGIVHNQLIFDGYINISSIRIRHYGYGLEKNKMEQKYERSAELLRKQLEENPDNTFALVNLAQIQRGMEKHDEVIKNASKVVSLLDPDNKSQLHLYLMAFEQLTSAYFFKGEFDKSIEAGLKALEIKSDYFDPMLTLGAAYAAKGDWENALKHYHHFLEITKNFDPQQEKLNIIFNNLGSQYFAHYGIGTILRRRGNPDKAEYYLRKVTDSVDNHMRVHHELGQIAFGRGDYDAAKTEFELDIKYNVNAYESYYMLGETANKTGDKNRAINYFNDSISRYPEFSKARFALAEVLNDSSQFNDARMHLDLLLEYDTEFSDAYRLRGDINFKLGEFETATDDYLEYLKFNEGDYKIIGNLGNSYLRQKKYDKAIESYRRGITLKPEYSINHLNLGVCLKEMGKWEEAASEFIEYYNLNPGDSGIFISVADCLTAGKLFTKAIDYYEKYITSNPADYLALFKLSECYRHGGLFPSAIMGYEAVLRMKPDFEPVIRILQLLQEKAVEI